MRHALIIALSILLYPILAGAEPTVNTKGLTATTLVLKFTEVVINPLIALLFAVAMVVFVYGLFNFMRSAAVSNTDQSGPMSIVEGKHHMFYGIIGMTIMVSVWGIIGIITNSIGVDVPTIQGGGGFR